MLISGKNGNTARLLSRPAFPAARYPANRDRLQNRQQAQPYAVVAASVTTTRCDATNTTYTTGKRSGKKSAMLPAISTNTPACPHRPIVAVAPGCPGSPARIPATNRQKNRQCPAHYHSPCMSQKRVFDESKTKKCAKNATPLATRPLPSKEKRQERGTPSPLPRCAERIGYRGAAACATLSERTISAWLTSLRAGSRQRVRA